MEFDAAISYRESPARPVALVPFGRNLLGKRALRSSKGQIRRKAETQSHGASLFFGGGQPSYLLQGRSDADRHFAGEAQRFVMSLTSP